RRFFLASDALFAVCFLSAALRVTTSVSSGEIAEHSALTYVPALTFDESLDPHPEQRATTTISVRADQRLPRRIQVRLAAERTRCSRAGCSDGARGRGDRGVGGGRIGRA